MADLNTKVVVFFADGYNDLYEASLQLEDISLICDQGKNATVDEIIRIISKIRAWNSSAVKANRINLFDFKNQLTAYQRAIYLLSDDVYTALATLSNGERSIDIAKLRRTVQQLLRATESLTTFLRGSTKGDAYNGIVKAEADSKDYWTQANKNLQDLKGNLTTYITGKREALQKTRIDRKNTFAGMVMSIFTDVELKGAEEVSRTDKLIEIKVKKPVTVYPPQRREIIDIEPVTVAIVAACIAFAAFLATNVVLATASISNYNSLGDTINSLKSDIAQADPVYFSAMEVTDATSILLGAFNRLEENFTKFGTVFILENDDRNKIMNDLFSIIIKSNWAGISNDTYKNLKLRLENNQKNFDVLMKAYAVIRSTGREKRDVYIVP